MDNREKEYIRELGTLYVKKGEKKVPTGFMCGDTFTKEIYEEVDIFKYLEEREYADKLNTYMKYRTATRYARYTTCAGNHLMEKDARGEFVQDAKGKYINIKNLEKQLNPEDIEKRIASLPEEKYKDEIKYTKVLTQEGYWHYVQDVDGNYIYNKDAFKFIQIKK